MNTKLLVKENPPRIFFCNEICETIYKYLPCVNMRLINSICSCSLNFIFRKTNIYVQLDICNVFNKKHKQFIHDVIFSLIIYININHEYILDMRPAGRYNIISYRNGNNILTLCHSIKKIRRKSLVKMYFPKDKLINQLKQIQSKINLTQTFKIES